MVNKISHGSLEQGNLGVFAEIGVIKLKNLNRFQQDTGGTFEIIREGLFSKRSTHKIIAIGRPWSIDLGPRSGHSPTKWGGQGSNRGKPTRRGLAQWAQGDGKAILGCLCGPNVITHCSERDHPPEGKMGNLI